MITGVSSGEGVAGVLGTGEGENIGDEGVAAMPKSDIELLEHPAKVMIINPKPPISPYIRFILVPIQSLTITL